MYTVTDWYCYNHVSNWILYFSFVYFLGVTVRGYHWISTPWVNTYFLNVNISQCFLLFYMHLTYSKNLALIGCFYRNFGWLIMCTDLIGSLSTRLAYSLCIGHCDPIKSRAHCYSGTDWFSIYRDIKSSRLEEA